MKFVLASQNVHKQRELQAVLAPYGVELLLQRERDRLRTASKIKLFGLINQHVGKRCSLPIQSPLQPI